MPKYTRAELQHALLDGFTSQDETTEVPYDIVEDAEGNKFYAVPVTELNEDQIATMIKQMDDFAAANGGYLNGTGGRLDRSNDDAKDEKFYFDKKKFTSRKGGKTKPRK